MISIYKVVFIICPIAAFRLVSMNPMFHRLSIFTKLFKKETSDLDSFYNFEGIKKSNQKLFTKTPGQLILIRHGESELSALDSFSGWIDCDLNENGKNEMKHAGRLMLERGYTEVDVVYTSNLKRSIRAAWVLLKELNSIFRPLEVSWRLNQRHFGAMEGASKEELEKKWGADTVAEYRNSLYLRPPPMTPEHPCWHHNERKYQVMTSENVEIPRSESIYDCWQRTIPFYEEKVLPDLMKGKTVMVVAHANSLRGLIRYVDNLSDDEVQKIAIPNGIPLVYKFDQNMKPLVLTDSYSPMSSQFLESRKALQVLLQKEKLWGDPKANKYKGLYSLIDYSQSTLSHPSTAVPLMQGLFILEKEREVVETLVDSEGLSDAESQAPDPFFQSPQQVETSSSTTTAKATATTIESHDSKSLKSDDHRISAIPTQDTQPDPNPVISDEYESTIEGPYLIFIRHGQTEYNKLGIFTGWDDAPLAEEGRRQAHSAGKLLKLHGIEFDIVYTSWLSRAIETAWAILDELDALWLPVVKSWRLNERMYGALTGMSKKGIAERYGEKQLKAWRRGYDIQPPPVNSFSINYPGNDDRYFKYVSDLRYSVVESVMRSLAKGKIEFHRKFPKTESLRDCMTRTIPYYTNVIVPESVNAGKRVLIASSENAIRGLLMHLCDIPRDRIHEIDIPNGLPLVFNLKKKCVQILDDGNETEEDYMNPLRRYSFGESPELLFKPCDFSDDGSATECFIGPNGKSYAWDPVVRLKKKASNAGKKTSSNTVTKSVTSSESSSIA